MGIHSPIRGTARAVLALILYAAVPYAAITVLRDPQAVGLNLDQTGYSIQGIIDILWRSVLFSPIMAATGFAIGYFRKGDAKRIWVQMASLAVGYAWFLFIINLGDLGGLITSEDALEIGGKKADLRIGIFVTGMIGIVAALKLLRIPIYYGQYKDHREEFLEKYDPNGYVIYRLANDTDEEYEFSERKKRRGKRWGSI
jgi:hypothetical protein